MAYAETTTIAVEKSIAEIVGLVKKAGAERVGQMEEPDGFLIQFILADRAIRFRVPLPLLDAMPKSNGRNQVLSQAQRRDILAQRHRQRARALLLVVKAKLESVESGVETFEQAFLANIVMKDGLTVYERISSPIADEYAAGAPTQTLLAEPGGQR